MLALSQGHFSATILWIVPQLRLSGCFLFMRTSCCQPGPALCRSTSILRSTTGFCLHFVIWLFFKLQSPFFHVRSDWCCYFALTWDNCVQFSGMREWKPDVFVCSKRLLVSGWRAVLFHCLSLSCARVCLCPLRCPSGLNCLCSVPPTAYYEVKCMCMPLCVLYCCMRHALELQLLMCLGNVCREFPPSSLKMS